MKKPLDINTSTHFWNSKWQKLETETVVRNIVLLAKRQGDWFSFSWDDYKALVDHPSTEAEHDVLDLLVRWHDLSFSDNRYSVTETFVEYLTRTYVKLPDDTRPPTQPRFCGGCETQLTEVEVDFCASCKASGWRKLAVV